MLIEEQKVNLDTKNNIFENLHLYHYQRKGLDFLISNDECCLEITAGTGMGKTAVAVTSIAYQYKYDKDNIHHGLFVYPTNALINNQKESIEELCKKLDVDINIEKITSINLTKSSEELNVTKSNILSDKLSPTYSKPTIVLTNPDILHLIVQRIYGIKKGGYSSDNIFSILLSYSYLVLDEFHFYSGRMLNLLFIDLLICRHFNFFPKMVFLSATPPKELKQIFEKFQNDCFNSVKRDLKPNLTGGTVKALHRLKFNYQPSGYDNHENILDYTNKNKYKIKSKLQSNNKSNFVPLCIIVDSVIKARHLSYDLDNNFNIVEIHGMVPSHKRRISDDTEVVIGTSAIELGIDFDASILIFTASTEASALQRFGRAGRHSKGEVHAFLPEYVCNYLDNRITGNTKMGRRKFLDHFGKAFQDRDHSNKYLSSLFVELDIDIVMKNFRKMSTKATNNIIKPKLQNLKQYLSQFFDEFIKVNSKTKFNNWISELKNYTNYLTTLRGSEPQILVYDNKAKENDFYPIHFSSVRRVLTKGIIQKVITNPDDIENRLCSFSKNYPKDSNINRLLNQLNFTSTTPILIAFLNGYKSTSNDVSVETNCKDELTIQEVEEENGLFGMINYSLQFIVENVSGEEISKLTKGQFYTVLPKEITNYLNWKQPYWEIESDQNKIVSLGVPALEILAIYDDKINQY